MKKDIVEIYKECGDFHTAVKKSGLPPLVAHIKLMKSGVLKIQDKIKYGSKAHALGGKAEEYFQKLVPEAVDANKYWKKNNPTYDFIYKNLTIDVKYSSKHNGPNAPYWGIRAIKSANICVAILEREEGKGVENPYILLIPNGFVQTTSNTHISKTGSFFNDFQVDEDMLVEMLDEYAGVFNDEL